MAFFIFRKREKSDFICNREPFRHHVQKSSDSTDTERVDSGCDENHNELCGTQSKAGNNQYYLATEWQPIITIGIAFY